MDERVSISNYRDALLYMCLLSLLTTTLCQVYCHWTTIMNSTIISIIQTIGDDDMVFDLKYDVSRDFVILERTQVNEIYLQKTDDPKTTFILAQPPAHTEAGLFQVLTDILVGILLENGSPKSYTSIVNLRHGNIMDRSVRDMASSIDQISVKFKGTEFDALQRKYSEQKNALYESIIQTYTFSGSTYDEYARHAPHIQSSVERMVRLFISMNPIKPTSA